jgi:carbonic anhydrase/acetyltransferase-like protein (isoleucine patch superfamily)
LVLAGLYGFGFFISKFSILSLLAARRKIHFASAWLSVINRSMNSLEKQFETFLRKKPVLGYGVYIAKGAVVLGDVSLGDHSSIWYNTVLRGDINRIAVGHHTNIQDNSVVHLADEFPCVIGNYVTVGHSAIVHACTVGDEVLVGMGAAILDGAVIGDQCLIGAHALVTPGVKIPAGSLVLGSPAKVARVLTPEERAQLKTWAEKYAAYAAYCLKHGINVSEPLPS